jgi:hypothetical protein
MDKTHTQGISPLDEKQEIGHAEHLDAHVSIPDSEKGPSEIPVPWPKDVINHGTEENKASWHSYQRLELTSCASTSEDHLSLRYDPGWPQHGICGLPAHCSSVCNSDKRGRK